MFQLPPNRKNKETKNVSLILFFKKKGKKETRSTPCLLRKTKLGSYQTERDFARTVLFFLEAMALQEPFTVVLVLARTICDHTGSDGQGGKHCSSTSTSGCPGLEWKASLSSTSVNNSSSRGGWEMRGIWGHFPPINGHGVCQYAPLLCFLWISASSPTGRYSR